MNNKWFVLLFNTVFFSLMAWLLPIHFEENDDVTMCMIANGVYAGHPDGHLVFINAIYGWVIAGLYMLTKVVEWYTLSFCLLHVLAMTGIVLLVIRDKGLAPLLKGVFLLFMYIIWARIIIGFQFTTTAGLLCFSGCMALLQHSKKWRIAGMGAVFVASLIRFSAAGLVGILFVPLFALEFVGDKRFAYWVLGMAFLALLGHFMDGLFYQQEDWAYYKAYNAVRGKIHDNPNAFLLSESDLPEGVAMEDYQLFVWSVGDPKIMDLERLRLIESRMTGRISFHHAMKNLSQISLYRIPLALLCLGYIFCLFLNVRKKNRERVVFVVAAIALFTIILVYLGMFNSLKNRVFLCMLVPVIYQMLKLFPVLGLQQRKECVFMMAVITMGFAVKYLYQDYKVVNLVRSSLIEFECYQLPLVRDFDGLLYTTACHIEYLHPFAINKVHFQKLDLGWPATIPFQKGVLESHRDFVDSEVLYFGYPSVDVLKAINRNYGLEVETIPVASNGKYALVSIKSCVK